MFYSIVWILFPNNNGWISDCDKDNCMFFHPDGTLLISKGSVKCDLNDKDVIVSWDFSNDGNGIRMGSEIYFSTFSIEPDKLIITWDSGYAN
jgi:hypothetical protein